MKNIFIIIFMLLIATPVMAQEECLFTAESLKPIMKEGLKNYDLKIDKENLELIETVTLEEGLKITYTVGGCAHYTYSFHFKNIPGGAPEMPVDPFGLPQSLLRRVPFKDGSEFQHMRDALYEKEASGWAAFDENDRTEWMCGNAFCSLVLHGSNEVILAYDFAM